MSQGWGQSSRVKVKVTECPIIWNYLTKGKKAYQITMNAALQIKCYHQVPVFDRQTVVSVHSGHLIKPNLENTDFLFV